MTNSKPSDLPGFLADKGIQRVIAFSGGAAPVPAGFGEDVEEAMTTASRRFETRVIRDSLVRLKKYNKQVAILTGGTEFGVPAAAAKIAKEEGFWTIGIFPKAGAGKALPSETLDIGICVDINENFQCKTPEDCAKFGSDWGDEAAYFAKVLDGAIIFGGGAGTLVELAHTLKLNERRLKNKQPPKFVVPIVPSGGVAAVAAYLPSNSEVKDACMPRHIVGSGHEAAEILEDKLNLDYLVDIDQVLQAAE